MPTGEMVRYGYKGNRRKDVLYTVRHEGMIFFGISRCNLNHGDLFDRELGLKIAAGRARSALETYGQSAHPGPIEPDTPEVTYYGSGQLDTLNNETKGYCKISDVKFLLRCFDNLNHRT